MSNDVALMQADIAGLRIALMFVIGKARKAGVISEAEVAEFTAVLAENVQGSKIMGDPEYLRYSTEQALALFGTQQNQAA